MLGGQTRNPIPCSILACNAVALSGREQDLNLYTSAEGNRPMPALALPLVVPHTASGRAVAQSHSQTLTPNPRQGTKFSSFQPAWLTRFDPSSGPTVYPG